jgi:hypothetical protein
MRLTSIQVLAASLSLAQAGIFDRNFFTPGGNDDPAKVEHAPPAEAAGGDTVTETVRHTVTVNGEGARGDMNMTAVQTVTVEAPAAACAPGDLVLDPHAPGYDAKKVEQ